jgi:hypothetical protein
MDRMVRVLLGFAPVPAGAAITVIPVKSEIKNVKIVFIRFDFTVTKNG